MNVEDTYLGDGVYAHYDGWYIVLDLRGQDNTTKIALDDDVLNSLAEYREHIKARLIESETVNK